MMTLSQLHTFQTVARLNSFSRAAEELHLTQPAVSAQIVALENALAIKLFDRIGKKIALTDAGLIVLDATEGILGRVDEMRAALNDLGGLRAGSLHIGASLVVGVYILPEILAKFKERYPQIDFTLRVELARSIVDKVARNELDIGIIAEGAPVTDERVAIKPILQDELVLIVPRNHPWSQRDEVLLSELADVTWVLPGNDCASSESVMEQIHANGITLKSVIELGNVGAAKRAVEAGLGVSIVSRCAILRELREGRLQAVRISGTPMTRDISLCWHHGKRFSKLTAAFINFVQKNVAPAH